MADDVLEQPLGPEDQASLEKLEGSGLRTIANRALGRKVDIPELSPPPKVTDAASYEAVPMGKDFMDPQGNVRTKPWQVKQESDYDLIPEGADFLDPEGNVRTKPSYENVSFTSQTLYDMAVNDKERKRALERSYPGKVKQLPSGEFFVEDDGTLRKPRKASDPKAGPMHTGALIAGGVAPTVGAVAGEIGGGLLGSLAGPAGTVGGAITGGGIGSAIGQGFNDLVLQLAGVYDRSGGEEAAGLATAGAFGAAGSAVGRGAAGLLGGPSAIKSVAPKAAGKFLGADPEGLETALKLAEKGVTPPLSGWAKEAPHLQNVVEVFDPAFHTQKPLLQSAEKHYESTAKGILDQLGVKPEGSIIKPTEAVPVQPAGERLMAKTLAESKAADDELARVLAERKAAVQGGQAGRIAQRDAINNAAEQSRQAAQRLIDQGYTEISRTAEEAARVSGAGHNGGELWEAVGARLQAVRRGIQERAGVMYRQADELAEGHLPNVEGLPERAAQFADQLPEEFQRNQPGLVRQLREMAGTSNPPEGAPGHVPDVGEWIVPPTQPTFGQLHNLRSQIRQSTDFYRLNSDIKNGTYKFFASRVDEALRDTVSVPELGPAVEQLNRADRFYRENMPIFEAQQIKAIMRGLEAGEPADPGNLFKTVVKEGHTDLTNRIREMVGPNLWAGVQSADIREMFQASRGLRPDEIDGRAFVREVLERHRSGVLEAVHSREVSQQLLRQAEAISMLEGRLSLPVRPGDTLTDVIGRARQAAEQAKQAARIDPLRTLSAEMKQVERDHQAIMRRNQQERKNDPLGFLYDPTTGAAEATNKILANEDLVLAAAARFGDKSPEFGMLRQIYAQRVLQGTMEPGAKLAKISPEVQQIMFPGTTLEQMQLLAKEMDFLMSSRGVQDTAKSMAAVSKVEHPWASILGRGGALAQVLTAPTKVLPGADAAGRFILGEYYGMIRKLTTSPAFLRWVQKGLKGDDAARLATKEAVQRFMQRGGAAGAGVAESQYQTSEPSPQPLPEPSSVPERRSSLDEGRVLSDADERPQAGQQYAMMDDPRQRRGDTDRFGNKLSGGGGASGGGVSTGGGSRVREITSMIKSGKTPEQIVKELNLGGPGYGDARKNLVVELSRSGMSVTDIFDLLGGK